MKPMIILPPGVMSEESIQMLRDNEICVVVAKNPAKVRFIDPLPCISSRTELEHAALQLAHKLLAGEFNTKLNYVYRSDIAEMFVTILRQAKAAAQERKS